MREEWGRNALTLSLANAHTFDDPVPLPADTRTLPDVSK